MITSRMRRFAGLWLLLMLGWLSRASAASFNIQTINPQSSLEGYSPASLRVAFTMIQAGTTQAWTAAMEGNPVPSWVSASPASGTGTGSVTLAFDTASLSPGTYSAALVLTSGSTISRKTFTLTVQPLNVIKMVPDSSRPWIYALHSSGSSNLSYVFTISTVTGKVTNRLRAGIGATDMTINREENRLYIANPTQSRIEVIDLQTLTSLPAVPSGTDIYRLNAGRAGRLYSGGEDSSALFILNSATGAKIGSPLYPGWGDGEVDPTGRFYYHAYASGAIQRFDVSSDSWASEMFAAAFGGASTENPLISPDGRRIFWAGGVYDAELKPLRALGQVIYATTTKGQLAVTGQAIVNATSGAELAPLPVITTISAVAGDDSAVYYFDPGKRTIGSTPLGPVLFPPGPVTVVTPPDGGAQLSSLAELKWEYEPMAFGYRVYFGTEAAAVEAAGTDSPEYAGETEDNAWKLPSEKVPPAGRFFWRVDAVGIDGQILKGAVHTFSTLPVTVPVDLSFQGLEGALVVPGKVPTGGVDGAPWAASTSGADWLAVTKSSGVKGEEVGLEFRPGDLAMGTYTANVTLTCNGQSDTFPVSLKVEPLKLMRLKADPARPRLYGIHAADPQTASLVSFRTGDGRIERVMPLSANPTGMDVTPDNRFLYVITQGGRQLHRIDLEDWSMTVQPLPPKEFNEYGPLLVAAAEGTRLCWSDGLAPSRLHLMDFATGQQLGAPVSAGETNGVAGLGRTADGSQLVVCGASSVWVMKTSSLTPVLGPLPIPWYSAGEVPVTARPDNSAVFVGTRKFSLTDGSLLREYPDSVQAATGTQGILFGYAGAWRETSLRVIWSLPKNFDSRMCALAGDESAFFCLDTQSSKLVRIPMDAIGEVPGPQPEDGEVVTTMPAQLVWAPTPGAQRYEVYFGQDPAGVDGASDSSSPWHFGTTDTTSLPLGQPLATAGVWWWRVDTVLEGSTVKGALRKFTGSLEYLNMFQQVEGVSSFEVPSLALEGATLLVGSAPWANNEWSSGKGSVTVYEKEPGQEEWRRIALMRNPVGAATDEFGSSVVMKGDIAWIGVPEDKTGGRALEYRRDVITREWKPTGRSVVASDPAKGGGFGGTLAFDGSLLAVAAPRATLGFRESAGVIEIFDATTLSSLATLSAAMPDSNGMYGQIMALGGGFLAVGDPRRLVGNVGGVKLLYGAVDMWTRDNAGIWTRTDELTAPVMEEGQNFGTTLALSGNTLFVGTLSETSGGKVYPFERGANGGWTGLAPVEAAVGATANAPVRSLAAAGDLLVTGVPDNDGISRGYASNVWLHHHLPGMGWIPVAPAVAPAPAQLKRMGTNVAVSGRYLVAVHEGQGYSTRRGISIHLHDPEANLPPVIISPPNPYAGEELAYSSLIRAVDDNPGDSLTFSIISGWPAWLKLEDHGDGTALLSGSPPKGSANAIGASIKVEDAHGGAVILPFEIKVVPTGDLPVVMEISGDQTVTDGGPVELKATTSATGGTVSWQWYRDGVPLPGRTQATLFLRHAQVSDSGIYHVRLTRNGRWVDSGPTHLTVNQAANRFGGDWPTFGAGTSRSGAYPAALGRHSFVPAWTVSSAGLNPVTVAEGRVYASSGYFPDDARAVAAFDLETGVRLWTRPLPLSYDLNSPTYHRGRLYLQRTGDDYSDPAELLCLEAGSGNIVWRTPFSSYLSRPPVVTVTEKAIFAFGSSPGGLFGFDSKGAELFASPYISSNGPAVVHEGNIFANTAGLYMLDPFSGAPVRALGLPSPYAGGSNLAADGNWMIMSGTMTPLGVDLDQWKVSWSQEDYFGGTAAVRGGKVYAIRYRDVQSYDAATGIPGLSYPIPEGTTATASINNYQPVVLEDTLIVPTFDSIYIFDLQSGKRLQKLAGGGPIAYSDGVLLASGQDQTLRAWRVNQPSVLTPQNALLSASPGVPVEWSLTVSDPDGDVPAVRTEGMPGWLSIIGPSAEGTVRLSGTPPAGSQGAFVFTVTADDGQSLPSTLEIRGTVVPPADAGVVIAPGLLVWNPGLRIWEQTVTVLNQGALAIAGFRIDVSGLTGRSILHNASGGVPGSAWVTSFQPLDAGGSVTLVLEYRAPAYSNAPDVRLAVSAAVPGPDAPDVSSEFRIDRAEMSAPGVFLLEFNTVPGKLYGVQYLSPGGVWTDSAPRVRAAGSRVQWLDEGAPLTGSAPGGDRSRFYRIRHLTSP